MGGDDVYYVYTRAHIYIHIVAMHIGIAGHLDLYIVLLFVSFPCAESSHEKYEAEHSVNVYFDTRTPK